MGLITVLKVVGMGLLNNINHDLKVFTHRIYSSPEHLTAIFKYVDVSKDVYCLFSLYFNSLFTHFLSENPVIPPDHH